MPFDPGSAVLDEPTSEFDPSSAVLEEAPSFDPSTAELDEQPTPSLRAAIPVPGEQVPLAREGFAAGVPQAFPASEQAKAETAKLPALTAGEAEQMLMTPQLHIPRVTKEGTALRGVENLVSGIPEFATSPAAPIIATAQLIPGVREAVNAVIGASMVKQGAQELGEASVTGNKEQLVTGAGIAILGATGVGGTLRGMAKEVLPKRTESAIEKLPEVPVEHEAVQPRATETFKEVIEGKEPTKPTEFDPTTAVLDETKTEGAQNASEISQATTLHGDVLRDVEGGTPKEGLPVNEGQPGIRSQAQGRIQEGSLENAVMDAVQEGGMIEGLKEDGGKDGHYVVAPPEGPGDSWFAVGPFKDEAAATDFLNAEVGAPNARVIRVDKTGKPLLKESAAEGGETIAAPKTETPAGKVEPAGGLPRPVTLPRPGIPKHEREAEFQRYMADVDRYDKEMEQWEAAQPSNKAIIFKKGTSYTAITKDPQGGWRATTFSQIFRDTDRLAPWGHERYKTRLQAVKENVGELADNLPEIMTEEEVKSHSTRPTEPKVETPKESTPEAVAPTKSEVKGKRGVERPPDIIDFIQERFGSIRGKKYAREGSEGYYGSGYDEARSGAGRQLFGKSGQSPDEVLDALRREGFMSENATVDDLWDAIGKANSSRRAHFRGETPEVQADKFYKALTEQGTKKSSHVVSVGDLGVGDTFTIGTEKMEVVSIDPDTGEVTVKDGRKFGYQTIPDGADIPVAKGSFKAKAQAPAFAKEDFALNAAESVEQQKARLAQEAAAAKQKENRAKMEEAAAKPLVGSTGDIGQKDMFGGDDLLSREPISVGPGAASPVDVTQPGTVVSNMFAAINRDRAELGKPPMEPGEPRTWTQDQQIATARMNRDPMWIPDLIKSVTENPRPLLSWEHAGVLMQKAFWKAEANNALRRIANAVDDNLGESEFLRAKEDAARFEDNLDALEKAVGTGGTGSEAGRTLQAQKMGLTDDLTLVEMRLEMRGRVGRRKLTEAESKAIEELHAKYQSEIESLKQTATEADKRRVEAETRATIAELARENDRPKASDYVIKTAERWVKEWEKEAAVARKNLAGKFLSPSPKDLLDLAKIVRFRIGEIGLDVAKITVELVSEFGEGVRPYINDAIDTAKKLIDTHDAKLPRKVREAVSTTIKKGDNPQQKISKLTTKIEERLSGEKDKSITPLVQKLARAFVESGIKEREALIDAVHDVLKDLAPDWTRRKTMDAISGYGDYRTLSKDEISVKLRELKGQMQQIGKLEDMASGEAPLRTGVERREVSQAESELIKLVNEAKRKGGYETTNPATQLRTALDEVKKRTQSAINDYERRMAEGDFTVRKLEPIRPDPELISMQAELKRTRKKWEQMKRDAELENRSRWQKVLDRFVRWERAFKLSSPVVFGKLAGAALTRFAETAATEVVGGALSKVPGISRVAEQAPREGGINVKAMAKGLTEAFTKGMKDAADTAKKGAADIDVTFGEKLVDKDWANFFGQLHGMMKAPVKRAEFTLSLEKRIEHAIKNGIDATDPLVMTRLATEALNDGYRSIFMQRGFSSDMFNQMVSQMEKSKKYPIAGEITARVARFLMPVVRVPANIVAETGAGIYGAPVASMRTMFHAVNGTLGKLDPVVADSIMRQFKKGSIGLGLVAVGYFNPNTFGGYDWRERQAYLKKHPNAPKAAGIQIGGVDIPRWLTHAPWFELMQFGATIRHVKDQHVKGQDKGIGEGMWAAGLGLVEETPFVGQMLRVDKLFQSEGERTYFLGELAKGTLIPQAIIKAAEIMDSPTPFIEPSIKRKPKTIGQHIEMGIPGLRQEVPKK